jgi:hypothetical protein
MKRNAPPCKFIGPNDWMGEEPVTIDRYCERNGLSKHRLLQYIDERMPDVRRPAQGRTRVHLRMTRAQADCARREFPAWEAEYLSGSGERRSEAQKARAALIGSEQLFSQWRPRLMPAQLDRMTVDQVTRIRDDAQAAVDLMSPLLRDALSILSATAKPSQPPPTPLPPPTTRPDQMRLELKGGLA